MIKRLIYILRHFLNHSFIRFAIVGSLGIITNLTIFFIFVDILKFWANVIAVMVYKIIFYIINGLLIKPHVARKSLFMAGLNLIWLH